MKRTLFVCGLALALLVSACSGDDGADEVVLMTHNSFLLSDGVLEAFTADTGLTVTVLTSGDAGTMVNQAILTKANPIADVMYGVDNTFLSRALDEGLFVPYRSDLIDRVPAGLRADDRVTPIDFGDVCLNTDLAALADRGLPAPETLRDLAEPPYAGTLVVEDPSTSSPGLAFLLATIATFGEEGDYTWRDFWADLVANDVRITAGWEDAYYGEFSATSTGDRPLVVSYASSPPAEVFFGGLDEAPTGVVTDGCFRQIEYAGILTGAANPDGAELLVDYLLSVPVQEDIPLNMFVYPANQDAALPEVFVEYTTLPSAPIVMDPGRIGDNRDRWIEEWLATVR